MAIIIINHLLGRRWHFVGSFVGPTLTNDLIANGWFDVGPTPLAQKLSPAYANHSVLCISVGSLLVRHDVRVQAIHYK